ncbi:hypothetical protein SK854_33675 [Lentzea sp. BCCO 10_0061]|uniref:Circularly permuted type 2 ATP-grasp protein n=1 Tax=Lentzea sokolovensis TaxID=3095429 RepID=A0ABU4V5M8_9PSEU|nr:hypothetical protein [Lentzea sp. BCCO 10_0061]MDX8147103.1 hypothetical protein [Lentzea sp. BCCO 10_0061]
MIGQFAAENAVTRRFLSPGRGSARIVSTLDELEREGTFRGGVPLLNRPVFLGAAEYGRLADDTKALHALLRELPERLFDGSTARMAAAVGMRPPEVEAVVRSHDLASAVLGRADFYLTSTGFRLLEFNCGSNIGGWDFGAVLDRALEDDDFRAFAAAEHLTYDDPRPAIARAVTAGAGDSAFVAIAGCPGAYDPTKPSFPGLVARLAAVGVEAAGCHLGQLEELGGRLYLQGRRVDVVHRMFSVADLIEDPAMPALVQMVEAIARAGGVRIFTPFATDVTSSKACLAMLSDDRNSAVFEPSQRELIARIVPWTRILKPEKVMLDGERIDLVQHVVTHRDRFVLKPVSALGGKGVVIGWRTPEDVWERSVDSALVTPHVVQERVEPVWERFLTGKQDEVEHMIVNWGVYSIQDMHGGLMLRASPASGSGVVSESAGSKTGAGFHVAEVGT